MKINIRGKEWKIDLKTEDAYEDHHGGDSTAITETSERVIHYHTGDLSLNTIVHELIHAYYAAGYTNSAELTLDQQEEIFCELFAEFGSQIFKEARKLRAFLKKESEHM